MRMLLVGSQARGPSNIWASLHAVSFKRAPQLQIVLQLAIKDHPLVLYLEQQWMGTGSSHLCGKADY